MLLQPRRVHELLMMRRTVMAWCRDSNIEGLVLARNGASSALFFAQCVGKPGCAKDHWQTTRTPEKEELGTLIVLHAKRIKKRTNTPAGIEPDTSVQKEEPMQKR